MMVDFGELAFRLSEATDTPTAAERLAEFVREQAPGAAVRVYVLGPGDRCAACPHARTCDSRDRCLHLEASRGSFACPRGHDRRVPRLGTPWGDALAAGTPRTLDALPPELAPPTNPDAKPGADACQALLVPMESAGEQIGLLGVRPAGKPHDTLLPTLRTATYLTAAAIRSLTSHNMATRRFEQLLLVNELGRKVNSILNDELLLSQAAVDIHRTFGFHNVMIFMIDEHRTGLELKAQASRYVSGAPARTRVGLEDGIVGRTYRAAQTEIIHDVGEAEDYVNWFDDTKSEMAVPIQIGGVVEGVLNVESDRVGAFGPADKLVLETVANQLAIAIENARLFGMVKEREDRYRTLVLSSPGGVLHLDAEGRIIFSNPAVTEITGLDKGQILARMAGLPDLCVEQEQDRVEEAVSAAIRGLPCRDLEFHVLHSDGGTRWVSAALQPLIGDQGDPKGVVVLLRDKTKERELRDKLTQSEKLSAIGTLVSGVAHELNNPLAGILGFAQLLLARPPERWARQDIEKIEKNARRCQRIVENLLAFARQSRMTKRSGNLNEVIDSVLNLNEYQFRMDNVEIVRDFDTRIPPFPIDVNRWQQVFVNLASNAHQALVNSDTKDKRIAFETRLEGSAVAIRISDTGPGIPDHMKRRIFEPFYTTKDKGTGLGLGICFGIVREHEGTIEIEDAPGGGALFVIRLPIQEMDEYLPPAHVLPVRSTSSAGEGKCVLVVDDDSYVCDVVARALRNHRYEVTIARDGSEALEHFAKHAFDVVVTDVRMPGEVDGIDLFDRVIAERPEFAERFVFMTGNLLDTRTMGRLEKLRVRFVEKPFDIHHLASVVNDISARGVTIGASQPPGKSA